MERNTKQTLFQPFVLELPFLGGAVNRVETVDEQLRMVNDFFNQLIDKQELAA